MTTETILYKNKSGVNTKDVLRSVNEQDQHWLKTVMLGYLVLENTDPRPEFKQWFNTSNDKLPRQPLVGNKHNSPKTFAEGILAKLEQDAKRRDLSPKQCEGIEVLSSLMSDIYEIPNIKFTERGHQNPINPEFKVLFKK